jgi:hypothetical protein
VEEGLGLLVLLTEEVEENEQAGEEFFVAALTTLLFGFRDGLLCDKSLYSSSSSEDKKISPLVNRWFMILVL